MTKFISINKCFLKIKIFYNKDLQIRHSSEWSEASTLILIAKNNKTVNNDNKYNYRLLMAKRSTKSSFMSNAYIFPGGKLDFDDFNHKWLKIFGNNNSVIRGNRPSLFLNSITRRQLIEKVKNEDLLSTDLALKIAAIREKFEETGILLANCDTKTDDNQKHILNEFRDQLRNGSKSFSDICLELKLRPNIESLIEWSNWMTPEIEKKRFDTLFYIAFIDSEPETHIDNRELTKLVWSTPEDMLKDYYSKSDILLAPPQVFELSRLKNIKDFDELKKFAFERQELGLEQWMPRIILRDSQTNMDLFKSEFVVTLPGDSHAINSWSKNSKLNRIFSRDTENGRKFFVECNIELPFGQLSPNC